jgi:hypothetical protein
MRELIDQPTLCDVLDPRAAQEKLSEKIETIIDGAALETSAACLHEAEAVVEVFVSRLTVDEEVIALVDHP